MFVGRKEELKILEDSYGSPKGELLVLYGRRRIGKSFLIRQFMEKKQQVLHFEALEGERTPAQIQHFSQLLREQIKEVLLQNARFESWEQIFTYLTERFSRGKKRHILFLDEFQWMAAGRNKLISLIKYYWDNHWKEKRVMLILCGSVASYMMEKVIRSKALYGRITLEIHLKGLKPAEAAAIFEKKRNQEEILKYLLIFGGVPKYLEEVQLHQSFPKNMNRLCFSRNGIMTQEIDRIFYSQFKETQTYFRIVSFLKSRIASFQEISTKLKIASGGGLKLYLDNLERAEIIRSFLPFEKERNSKWKKYTLTDEFLLFYFKFIEPNLRIIQESDSKKIFETLTQSGFDSWLGFAFERFCIKNATNLAHLMGFGEEVLVASPFFGKADEQFQIDLLYRRSDKVITLCEVKHSQNKISTKIIPEIERKCALLSLPRGYSLEKSLISLYGPDTALEESQYFDHSLTLEDLLEEESLRNM